MDDHELEQRLRTHLHRRFDDAPLPAGLEAAVLQGIATTPRRVRFDLRRGSLAVGWSAVAAIAIVVVGFMLFGSVNSPFGPGTTPVPSTGTRPGRSFIVLPPTSALPSKAASTLASAVLEKRLQALGFGTFVGSIGNAIRYSLPAAGPSDVVIRNVLAATGDVTFVPLPAAYKDGTLTAEPGKALPTHEPAMFGWEGIDTIELNVDQQSRTVLDINLKPAAATSFAEYTTAHVSESFAILIDGVVALVPVINEPVTGGMLQVSGGVPAPDPQFLEASAILVGGVLPSEWRGALVPEILSRDEAIGVARTKIAGGLEATVDSADLDATQGATEWEPTWNVVFSNIPANGGTSTMKVIIDARPGS